LSKEEQKTQSDPLEGKEIGRYKLIKLINGDSQPLIYEARDRVDKSRAIVYLVTPKYVSASGKLADRFLIEARVASKVHHPAIVPVLEAADCEGYRYVSTSCFEGISIASSMAKRGKLGVEEAVEIGIQLTRAIEAAHAAGCIHRDISPHVIYLTPEGSLIISRLGVLAVVTGLDINSELTPDSPYAFWAPEMFLPGVTDGRTDVFSIGATLYYLVTGKLPFCGVVSELREKFEQGYKPPRAEKLNPEVPKALGATLSKMLKIDPEKRFPNLAITLTALERAMAEPGEERDVSPELLVARDEARRLVSEAGKSFARLRASVANRKIWRAMIAVMVLMAVAVLGTLAGVYIKHRSLVGSTDVPIIDGPTWIEKVNQYRHKILSTHDIGKLTGLNADLSALERERGPKKAPGLRKLLDEALQKEFKALSGRAADLARKGNRAAAMNMINDIKRFNSPQLESPIRDALAMLDRIPVKPPPVKPPPPKPVIPPPKVFDSIPKLVRRLPGVSRNFLSMTSALKVKDKKVKLGYITYTKGGVTDLSAPFSQTGEVTLRSLVVKLAVGGRMLALFQDDDPILIWKSPAQLAGSPYSGKSAVFAMSGKKFVLEVTEEIESAACKVTSRIEITDKGRGNALVGISYDLNITRVLKNSLQFGLAVAKPSVSSRTAPKVHYRTFTARLIKGRSIAEAAGKGALRQLTLAGNLREIKLDMVKWAWKGSGGPLKIVDSPNSFSLLGAQPRKGKGKAHVLVEIRHGRKRKGPTVKSSWWPAVTWPDIGSASVKSREQAQKGKSIVKDRLKLAWTGKSVDFSVGDKWVGKYDFKGKCQAFIEDMGSTQCLYVSRISGAQRFETYFRLAGDGVRIYEIWCANAPGKAVWIANTGLTLYGAGFGGLEAAGLYAQDEAGYKVPVSGKTICSPARWCELRGRNLKAYVSIERQSLRLGAAAVSLSGQNLNISRQAGVNGSSALKTVGRVAIIFSGKAFSQK